MPGFIICSLSRDLLFYLPYWVINDMILALVPWRKPCQVQSVTDGKEDERRQCKGINCKSLNNCAKYNYNYTLIHEYSTHQEAPNKQIS